MSIEENTGCCRECGAEVIWVVSEIEEKVPVDVAPTQGFVLINLSNGKVGGLSGCVYAAHECAVATQGEE